MTTAADPTPEVRVPLNRERVLRAAVSLADDQGIDALTMRRLGKDLGVEAMSLYNHVANKEDLLDGVVDQVILEIDEAVRAVGLPSGPDDWKPIMRDRFLAARRVLVGHPWAPALIETRSDAPPSLTKYFDDLIGAFRTGGFSLDLTHHALHALGSRALGFTQELFEPDDPEASEEASRLMLKQMADTYPNIVAMVEIVSHDAADDTFGWCDDQTEFVFGIDLILDGLEARRDAE